MDQESDWREAAYASISLSGSCLRLVSFVIQTIMERLAGLFYSCRKVIGMDVPPPGGEMLPSISLPLTVPSKRPVLHVMVTFLLSADQSAGNVLLGCPSREKPTVAVDPE